MARYAIVVVSVWVLALDQCVSQDTICSGDVGGLNDGFCDYANNNLACDYDGGDCCSCTCVDSSLFACDSNGYNCQDPACPDEDPSPYPNCTWNFNSLEDGWCDPEPNNLGCGYDGGDCCECTCTDGPLHSCGSNGFNCTDPACFDPAMAIEYPECSGKWLSIGDGLCTAENNNPACGYDGGDCCLCTCSGRACVYSDFDCSDPSVGDEFYDCKPPPPTALPCSADIQRVWEVRDSVQARALAEAVNCSGGSFEALWIGDIVVDKTIYVYGGTVLNMTGAGSIASMDGNSATRLLTVVDAFMHVTGINMSYGAGTVGGAVAAVRSSLTFSNSSFYGNTAAGHGGGVYATEGSVVSFAGRTSFSDNTAAIDGGAVFIMDSLCTGEGVAFFNNTAGGDGGALMITEHSSLSWSGKATYRTNRAGRSAGALALQRSSHASWYGETVFDSNDAGQYSGALHVLDDSHVSWVAATIFSNNRAGLTGGAMRVTNSSSVSWTGITKFLGNSGFAGGAMTISGKSTASLGGNTTFSANTAEALGGAVFVSDYSIVSWDGETTFSSNLAGQGGAVYAMTLSDLSFDGRTTFHGNLAVDVNRSDVLQQAGGALALFNSTVTFSGNTTFSANKAEGWGGAVFVTDYSIVKWDGETTFSRNLARNGGAVFAISSSSLTFGGKTAFYGNPALGVNKSDIPQVGGALTVYYSSVTLSGETTFANNQASMAGGAVAFYDVIAKWTGRSSFLSNAGGEFGGALYLINSSVVFDGNTTFQDNTADNGGAVMALDSSSVSWDGVVGFTNNVAFSGGALALLNSRVTFRSRDVLFIGNSAEVVGGGVYVSSVGVGLVFSGVRFEANFAGAGGGAYVTGSGNDNPNPTDFETIPVYATKFDGCEFVDNWATETGGAIETAISQDHISNTRFVGNTAGIGGALRLGGKTFLDNCSFVDNRSGEEAGPAVDNIGYVGRIINSYFISNVFNCEPGTYLAFNESDRVFEVACNGCGDSCQGCTFEEPLVVPICTQAMQHSTSSGGASTLETVSINRGFWRATSTSEEVLACHRDDACLGGVTGSRDYCLHGYEGPYCSICSDGYATGFGFACDTCSNKAGGIVLTIVLAVIALLSAAAIASYTTSSNLEGDGHGTIERVTRFIPLQSIKIVIVALQIVTQFTAIADVIYPHVYQHFLDTVNVLNFDLGWVSQLSVGCLFDVGIHGRLLIATIGPIVAVMFLLVTYLVATNANRGSAEALSLIRHRHVSMVLLLTFLVYSSVSSILFQMFACENLEDGQNYLRADYRVQCDSSKHKAFQIYAGFMIVLYTVGIPTLYTSLLFRDREVLKDEVGREENPSTKSFSDLWKPYKPSRFYYEVIECGRRVLLTGAVVFIYPNTSAQIAVTLMIAFVFAMMSEGLAPFASRWDTWISRMGHVVVYVSMYVALLLKVDVSDERSSSQKVFEAVLVVAHLGMILAVIIETAVMVCSLRKTVREGISPKARGTKFPLSGVVQSAGRAISSPRSRTTLDRHVAH